MAIQIAGICIDDINEELEKGIDLTGVMINIKVVVGFVDAMRIAWEMGGCDYYIGSWHDDSQKRTEGVNLLVNTVGEEKAKKFISEFSSEKIEIPKCHRIFLRIRNRHAVDYLKSNSMGATARKFSITVVQLRSIISKEQANNPTIKSKKQIQKEAKLHDEQARYHSSLFYLPISK